MADIEEASPKSGKASWVHLGIPLASAHKPANPSLPGATHWNRPKPTHFLHANLLDKSRSQENISAHFSDSEHFWSETDWLSWHLNWFLNLPIFHVHPWFWIVQRSDMDKERIPTIHITHQQHHFQSKRITPTRRDSLGSTGASDGRGNLEHLLIRIDLTKKLYSSSGRSSPVSFSSMLL